MNVNLTTLNNFKNSLNVSVSDEDSDAILSSIITRASGVINDYCNRKFRGNKYSLNTNQLDDISNIYLPNYPLIAVDDTEDEAIIFSDIGLVKNGFSTDLETINYYAGFEEFQIYSDVNDKLQIVENSNTYNIVLAEGVYYSQSLIDLLVAALNVDGTLNYTVKYINDKFVFGADGSFQITFTTADSLKTLLGFASDSNDSINNEIITPNSVIGIPSEIEQACLDVARRIWNNSSEAKNRFDIESEQMQGEAGGTLKFNTDPLPPMVKEILQRYIVRNI